MSTDPPCEVHVTAGKADQIEVVECTLLSQLQNGMSHMVVEGAEYTVSQALPLSNDQPLHEHIQSFLIQPLPQQTHTLHLQQNTQLAHLQRAQTSTKPGCSIAGGKKTVVGK